MGIVDQIKSRVVEVLDPAGHRSAVVNSITDLLEQHGGLSGTLQKLHEKGLGEVASSWVGDGENLPISSEQIESAFGSDKIEAIARKVGVPDSVLKMGLAKFLPVIVDHLTPDGKLPSQPIDIKSAVASGLGFLGKKKAA